MSTGPLSSVPVQFLVNVVSPPTCTIPPNIIGDSISDSCVSLTVGQNYTTRIYAINSCGIFVSISDIATLSFDGLLKGSLVKINSTTYYKTLTWTPTIDQIGYQVMCAMAYDRFVSHFFDRLMKIYSHEFFLAVLTLNRLSTV